VVADEKQTNSHISQGQKHPLYALDCIHSLFEEARQFLSITGDVSFHRSTFASNKASKCGHNNSFHESISQIAVIFFGSASLGISVLPLNYDLQCPLCYEGENKGERSFKG
jgi:hypothetical protein